MPLPNLFAKVFVHVFTNAFWHFTSSLQRERWDYDFAIVVSVLQSRHLQVLQLLLGRIYP